MPLQNRVNPQGNIISTSARGAWLGNRGVIHNPDKQIVRQYKIKAWIICMLEFRGRHREVMVPGRWTELFFLDEATAFSAGHRPCFQCRYAAHRQFKSAWLKGNPQYGFTEETSIKEIDNILQQERIYKGGNQVTFEADIQTLPDGTFTQINGHPYLLANGAVYDWTPFGYGEGKKLPKVGKVTVLTPISVVNAFHAGYYPQMAVGSAKPDMNIL